VTYLPSEGVKAADFWEALEEAGGSLPGLWGALGAARGEDAVSVNQAFLLAGAARQRGLRHLHAHFATLAATVARLAARFTGLSYSFTAHAKDIFHDSVCPDDLGRKLRDAAAVITVSDYNRDYLRATYGAAAGRGRRVYNGLDLGEFSYRSPEDRLPRVVAVGRLIEKKGFADLIEACALLAAHGRLFTCQILGSGELEADLRAQVERRGLVGRVELLGPRPQSEVIRAGQGPPSWPRRASSARTATGTACPPSSWRRWHWGRPAFRPV